jgi:DNA-binding PadR family transcriptional regulator
MSLDHAILGFLNYGPLTGYELKKIFDNSVQHFWPADQSQIYRTLGRLVTSQMAEVERVRQESRPDRKVYTITDAGRQEFRRWMTTTLPPQDNRSAELIQVFFAARLSDEQVLDLFRPHAEGLRRLLDVYARVPQVVNQNILPEQAAEFCPTARDQFFWMLTLECGVTMARAELEWIESVIQRIENHQIPAQQENANDNEYGETHA